MGVNDAQEMLEAAQEECIRLEKELAELATSYGPDHIAAKYWKQRQDARNKLREAQEMIDAQIVRGNSLAEQLAAALAVIEQVKAAAQAGLADCDDDCEMSSLWVLETTTQNPASALARVKADVWDEGFTIGNRHDGRRDANPYREEEGDRG